MSEKLKVLEWDSAFFSRKIACLYDAGLLLGCAAEFHKWVADNKVDCVYFLAQAADIEPIRLAESQGFKLVDLRLTLSQDLDVCQVASDARSLIRKVERRDIAELKKIAGISHRGSRFYRDGNFNAARCDNLYETWIEKSCDGFADAVFIVELEKTAAGYITCHLQGSTGASIGLLGISESLRGQGVGRSLVTTALAWLREQGRKSVSVATQGHNISAQKLYQRCGFVSQMTEIWYHYWPRLQLDR